MEAESIVVVLKVAVVVESDIAVSVGMKVAVVAMYTESVI